MGICITRRNKHRKHNFSQVGGRARVGDSVSARDTSAVLDANRARKAAELQAYKITNQKLRVDARLAASRQNIEKVAPPPPHPRLEQADTSVANKTKDSTDLAAADRKEKLDLEVRNINTDANRRIAAEEQRKANLTEAARAAEEVFRNHFIPENPSPAEVAIYQALQASARARTQALEQGNKNSDARIASIKSVRDAAVNIAIQKANLQKAIQGWNKVASSSEAIYRILINMASTFTGRFTRSFLGLGISYNRVERNTALADDTTRLTQDAQRSVTDIVLTQTTDPTRLSKEISDRYALIVKLTGENIKINGKLGSLVREVKARSDSLPGLLNKVTALQFAHDGAVSDRAALEAQRDALTAPDYTAELANINRQIDTTNQTISDLSYELSRAGTDIISAVSARDFLIAAKADAEAGVLQQLVINITGTDAATINSRANLDAARAMNNRIAAALKDIAAAVTPYRDTSATLRQLILDIEARNRTDLTALNTQNGLLGDKTNELTTAIQLLADTLEQNRIDIGIIQGINDNISNLLAIRASHEHFSADILSILQRAHDLEGELAGLRLSSENLKIIVDSIQNRLVNDVGPALSLSAANEGGALNAFSAADANLTTLTSNITTNTQTIITLGVIQNNLIRDISIRNANLTKAISFDGRRSSLINRRTAENTAKKAVKPSLDTQRAEAKAQELSDLNDALARELGLSSDADGAVENAMLSKAAATPEKLAAAEKLRVLEVPVRGIEDNIASEGSSLGNLQQQIAALGERGVLPRVPPTPPQRPRRQQIEIPRDPGPPSREAVDKAISDRQDAETAALLARSGDPLQVLNDAINHLHDIEVQLKNEAESLAEATDALDNFDDFGDQLAADDARLAALGAALGEGPIMPPKMPDIRLPTLPDPVSPPSPPLGMTDYVNQLLDRIRGVIIKQISLIVNRDRTRAAIDNTLRDIDAGPINQPVVTPGVSPADVDIQLIESNGKQAELRAAEATLVNLTTRLQTHITNKNNLLSHLRNLGNYFSISNNRTAQYLRVRTWNPQPPTQPPRPIPLVKIANSTVARDAIRNLTSNNNDIRWLIGRRDRNTTDLEALDVAINGIDLAGFTANRVATETIINSINRAIASNINHQISESAQLGEITQTISNRDIRPVLPEIRDGRYELARLAAEARARAQALRDALSRLILPDMPNREAVERAIRDKIIARDNATRLPNVDPRVHLDNTKKIANEIKIILDASFIQVQGAEVAVTAADVVNTESITILTRDEATLLTKYGYLSDVLRALNKAKTDVDAADPVPFERDLKLRQDEMPPYQDPPTRRQVGQDPLILAAKLGEIVAAANATRILKEDNDSGIRYLDEGIVNTLRAIDTNLFNMPDLTGPRITSEDAFNNLDTALKNLLSEIQTHVVLEQNYIDLNSLLIDLRKEFRARENLNAALNAAGTVRDNFRALRNNLKALRDGMNRLRIANKNIPRGSLSIVNESINKLNDTITGRDRLVRVDLPDVESGLSAARIDESNAAGNATDALTLHDFFKNALIDDIDPHINSEVNQADDLKAQLSAARPAEPTPVVDNRPAAADSAALAHNNANMARDQLRSLVDPGANRQPVDDAIAAKDSAKINAEALQKLAVDNAASALADATNGRNALNKELAYALGILEAAVSQVDSASLDNATSIDSLRNARAEAERRLKIVNDLKIQVDKYNKTIDDTIKLLDSLRLPDLPPHQDPPTRGQLPPDLSSKLAEFRALLDRISAEKDDIFTSIRRIQDELPQLNDDIIHAINRVNEIFGRISNRDLLNKAADLAIAKGEVEHLNNMNIAGLQRINNLKTLKISLELYEFIRIRRNVERLNNTGKLEARRLAKERAQKARDAAKNIAKRAKKGDMRLRMSEIDALNKQIADKKAERDASKEQNDKLDSEILKMEKLMSDLLNSLLGRKMKEIALKKREFDAAKRNKKLIDDEIARRLKELDAAIKKYGDDSDIVRRLEDELARLKKIRDDLAERIRLREKELDALIKERDELLRKKKEHEETMRKEKEALDELRREENRRRGDLLLFNPNLTLAAQVAAAALGAAALAYTLPEMFRTPIPETELNPDDGGGDGSADGARKGAEDGRRDGNALAGSEARTDASISASDNAAAASSVAPDELSPDDAQAEVSPDELPQDELPQDELPQDELPPDEVNANANDPVSVGGAFNANVDLSNSPNANVEVPPNSANDPTENANVEVPPNSANVEVPPNSANYPTANADAITDADADAFRAPSTRTIEEGPDPTSIPYPSDSFFIGKSAKYVKTYKSAFKTSYIRAYKTNFKDAYDNYRSNKLPPGISSSNQKTGEIYYIKSEIYGVDGYYILISENIPDTGEYYEVINTDTDPKKRIILTSDAENFNIYKANYEESDMGEPTNGNYLEYTPVPQEDEVSDNGSKPKLSNLILLTGDIDSEEPLVTVIPAEDVEQPPAEDAEISANQSAGYQILHDDFIEPTF